MHVVGILDGWPQGMPLYEYFERLPIEALRRGWVPCMCYIMTASKHSLTETLAPAEIARSLHVVSKRLCRVKWTTELEVTMPKGYPNHPRTPIPAPPIDPTALNPPPASGVALKTGAPPPPKRSGDKTMVQIYALCKAHREGVSGYVEVDPKVLKMSSLKTKVTKARNDPEGNKDLWVYEAANGKLIVIVDPNRPKRGLGLGAK